MLGWRGRIGYVSPASIRLPWELTDLLPEGVALIATNLRVRGYTDAEFARAQAGIAEAVEFLAGEGAQAILLAGVPVAVRGGYAPEQQRLADLRQRFGVPVVFGVAACVEGFRRLGVRTPVVATAYLDAGRPVVGSEGARPPRSTRAVACWTRPSSNIPPSGRPGRLKGLS